MIKARSKKLSILLVLAMLMTMFVGLGTAGAASGYSVSYVPVVNDDGVTVQDLGTIIVSYDNLPAGANEFIVKLPKDFVVNVVYADLIKPDSGTLPTIYLNSSGTKIPIPANGLNITTAKTNQFIVGVNSNSIVSELKFALRIKATIPEDAAETINAMLVAQPGSVFPDGVVQVARTSSGAVTALAGDPINITETGGKGAVVYLRENKAEALKEATLKLPSGFKWSSPKVEIVGVATANNNGYISVNGNEVGSFSVPDGRSLKLVRTAGKLNDKGYIWKITADINVDEKVAKFGDVEVSISGKDNISPSSVVIGTYKDYGVNIKVGSAEEIIAGDQEAKIAKIEIKNNIDDSIIANRIVYLQLPEGVEWASYDEKESNNGFVSSDEGIKSGYYYDERTLKITTTGKNITIEEKVNVDYDFTGDVVVKIYGNAGVEGEALVAKVIPPFTVKAEVKDVIIGAQNQAGGKIVIAEPKADVLQKDDVIAIELPYNVVWYDEPVAKVVEGDLEIDSVDKDGKLLTITIKSSSSKASKIELSGVAYTVDRTVPEGEMKAIFGMGAKDGKVENTVVKAVVANCVTPAQGAATGMFKIGSNIYYVGGNAKVMDVAPYIKNARTYVPMRYLGEILGAEVVWNDAARTVTLTKGSDVVVFTIGSTTYTVNGETKTADVAPEISNSRTMLPARFVAEAFGAQVGWDAGTQTVLIQK